MSESLKGFTLWRENSSLLLSMMSWCQPSLSLRGLCRAEETVCHSPGCTGGDRTWSHLQGGNPVVVSAEVQYTETLGCDQYGLKKKAEREQMKIKVQLVYLFFTFCFDF